MCKLERRGAKGGEDKGVGEGERLTSPSQAGDHPPPGSICKNSDLLCAGTVLGVCIAFAL